MKYVKKIFRKIPVIKDFIKKYDILKDFRQEYYSFSCYPPGHFYSPIVNLNELSEREGSVWSENYDSLYGIDLNIDRQVEYLKNFSLYRNNNPFTDNPLSSSRYYFSNPYFTKPDGIILFSMLMHLKPKRIIEIGSGFSSALMMDVNNKFFGNTMNLTFIDPFAERLKSLIKDSDSEFCNIIEEKIQDTSVSIFKDLDSSDILFIDSTHVCKTGSDVNHILFKILPELKDGVIIHFHDIFYPFEYPKSWVYEGRNWNENYLLRAFLLHNSVFSIEFFNSYIFAKHNSILRSYLPEASDDGGGSLWIRKNGDLR